MHRFHLFKRLYSSSTHDIVSINLHNRINSFLSKNVLNLDNLLQTHSYIITTGHTNNIFLASKLISHYASLNQPQLSTKVFDTLSYKDPFLWNSLIKAHFSNGNYPETLHFFSSMLFSGALLDQFTVPMVVSTCAEVGSLSLGMNVHGLVSKLDLFHANSAIGSSFLYMYAKCGLMKEAYLVFDEMPVKDVVAWTALVIGYVQNDESEKGLECLREMHMVGGDWERPNFRTLEGGFQACSNLSAWMEGRCLHGLAIKTGNILSRGVQSSVLSMYSKCGIVRDAETSFYEVADKDLLSWTSIIGVYAKLGWGYECCDMFLKMLAEGIYPDGMVICCALSGLANSMVISDGKAFHCLILRRNYEADQIISNALLSMYCKFGLPALAEKLFDGDDQGDISWNSMVIGYWKAGNEVECLKLFRKMQYIGIQSDLKSYVAAVSACSKLKAIHLGRSLHCHVLKNTQFDSISVPNSLIDMYGKSGNLAVARTLFCAGQKDIVTWNSLISSYAHNGHYSEALALLENLVSEGLKPNTETLVTLLSACAQIASVEKGNKIIEYVRKEGFEYNVALSTALIDMYGKCGQLKVARETFDLIKEKDVICWNVMISCYGMHGCGTSAIEIFQKMEQSNIRPNELTFLAILSACAHAGLIEEGKHLFRKMKGYSLTPTLKHYCCIVDLLGRSGSLEEAEAFVLSMPIAPDGGIWGSLLTACKNFGNTEMGIRVAKCAIETDPDNDGYYVVISDLYSSVGMWDEVERVRKILNERGIMKTSGWSTL